MYKKGNLRIGKRAKDAVHAATQLMQEWDDRLDLETCNLLERYIKGKLGVHLHCEIGFSDGILIQYCAVLQGKEPLVELKGSVFHVNGLGSSQNNMDQPVLIAVIHFVQYPKRVIVCGSSAMVGLNTLDECPGSHRDLLYQGCKPGGFVFLRALKDRKLNLGVRVQAINSIVQGRTELVCDLASDQTEINGWLTNARCSGDVANDACINVFLDSQRVRATVEKTGGRALKVLDVMIGPFNLGEHSI